MGDHDGLESVITIGWNAHCCDSTARDAMMMNYKVFFIADACAALTDAEQAETLSAMAHTFCDVRDIRSMLCLIAQD
ncbi:isochorismatase family protein (plasmid) [Bradyrhizobium sp. PMVTL-01]|uniref:isochorismatase family protein n=1 Tax=Bradyrhizobium sp. PMVTL-01 TaxID=3434999 RepID=UPI003F72CED5